MLIGIGYFLSMFQGLLQGIACTLIYPLIVRVYPSYTANTTIYPSMMCGHQVALPAQWFLKRRAFAIGIIVAGSSLGENQPAFLCPRCAYFPTQVVPLVH